MDNETAKIIGFLLTYVLGIFVLGIMASRKNRDYMAWGLIGGLFCIPCFVALAFLPPLCPKCKRPLLAREWRRGVCPICGSVRKQSLPNERGYVLLEKGTNLETQGKVQQALVVYRDVIETYPDTPAAIDAQKSLDDLRERLG